MQDDNLGINAVYEPLGNDAQQYLNDKLAAIAITESNDSADLVRDDLLTAIRYLEATLEGNYAHYYECGACVSVFRCGDTWIYEIGSEYWEVSL